MARILDDLVVKLNPEGTGWRLTETLEYGVGSKDSPEKIEVDPGFPTDFASVPRPARALMSTWKKTARAAVVHDYLYALESREKYGYSKRQADLIFLEVLGVVGHRLRFGAWAAVRVFGRPHWQPAGSEGVGQSKVTPLTASQFALVFFLGLFLTAVGAAVGGAALFYGLSLSTDSVALGKRRPSYRRCASAYPLVSCRLGPGVRRRDVSYGGDPRGLVEAKWELRAQASTRLIADL